MSLIELNNNALFFILIGLGVLILFLIVWIWRLEVRIKKILGGKNGDLESAIKNNHQKLEEFEKFKAEIVKSLSFLETKLRRSVQTVETIRFNPFKGSGVGGNQSFSSVFLNEKGDGVVFSGLHLRDRMSVYAKPLKSFNAEFELTEEEKGVITIARQKLSEH